MAKLKCPSGMIVRNAYTTKRGVHVPATCVPDKGAPGKTPASRKVLPKPKKGSLGKYGYANIKHTSAASRRVALRVAVEKDGYATIIRRLNLLANYTKVSDPETHKIMRADIAWIQKMLKAHSLTAQRRGSKKGSKKVTKKASMKGSKKGKVISAGGVTVSLDAFSAFGNKLCDRLDERIKNLKKVENKVVSNEDLVRMAAMKKKMCGKLRKVVKKLEDM